MAPPINTFMAWLSETVLTFPELERAIEITDQNFNYMILIEFLSANDPAT
ncbi:hypothetical protein [Pseudolabrys sp. FHR47]|nr:hypothetical protein [Pseudolabrys sp. FHR47]